MVVEYIRYAVPAEQREPLTAAYQQAAPQLDAAPECLSYELTECEEEAGQFILRIEWESTEAHLQGFRKSPEFAAFFGHIKGFFPIFRKCGTIAPQPSATTNSARAPSPCFPT